MKPYLLQKIKEGRVVLHEEKIKGAEIIRTIPAETWLDARESVHWAEFKKRDGYGYYAD